MRRKWLDRLVKALRHEVMVDRHFVNERFSDDGESKRLDQLLEPPGVITSSRVSRTAPYSMPGGGALSAEAWLCTDLFLCLRTRI
ncbi:hypothetical protein M2367_003859 [Aeromonas sp. BIGb0445]|nr:hypothetical protein [Aeromonas sp. BIGb0445]